MTARHVTKHRQAIFTESLGPDTLVCDYGPYYNAAEFKEAMEYMGIAHTTSSPHYHQSNGLAKKFVQVVKGLSCIPFLTFVKMMSV